MAGNQSRGLIRASITKGWDPRVIQGTNERIDRFDVDQGNAGGRCVGRLPGGTPDGWRDGFDTDVARLRFDAPVPFAHPDTTRETVSRRTVNGHHAPGRPGATPTEGE